MAQLEKFIMPNGDVVELGGSGGKKLIQRVELTEDVSIVNIDFEDSYEVYIHCCFNGSSANPSEQPVNVDLLYGNNIKKGLAQHLYASRVSNVQPSLIHIVSGKSLLFNKCQVDISYATGHNTIGQFNKFMSIILDASQFNGISFNTTNINNNQNVIGAGSIFEVYKVE